MTEGMGPRILTAEELEALPRCAIVFAETFDGEDRKGGYVMAAMKCQDGTLVDEDGCIYMDFRKEMEPGHFGDKTRFWSMLPKEELMACTPWE